MVRRIWRLALALAACGGADDLVVAPIIDTPEVGTNAAAFPDLDQLELTLAHAGAVDDLASATFGPGDVVELRAVPEADDLVIHLTGRLGSTEVAYGRTCPFAVRLVDGDAAPHLFFARTVKWADATPPSAATRHAGRAARYHDGSAVFVGGLDDADQPIAAVDRFDPRTGGFTIAATVSARRDGELAALGDGRLLVFGGLDGTGALTATVEVIELDGSPGRRVETVSEPRLARRDAATASLADGRAMVFGGIDATGPAAGDVVEIAADGPTVAFRRLDARLAVPRHGASATRLSDDLGAPVAIIGGVDASGAPIGLAELWKPLREAFTDPARFHPTMRVPRSLHHAVRLPDGSVLILGGLDAAGQPVRQLERFSTDDGFADAGLMPATAGLLDATATALPDGRVLLTGGRLTVDGPPVASVFIARLNPLDGSIDVVATDPLGRARAGHQAAMMCDGTVLVIGGGAGPAERYNPPPGGRR